MGILEEYINLDDVFKVTSPESVGSSVVTSFLSSDNISLLLFTIFNVVDSDVEVVWVLL